jgi:carbonic anhydrase/acetyltransferase-like protein (isoleucine patch superfamily)
MEVVVGRKAEAHGSVIGCTIVVAKNASVEKMVGKQLIVGEGAKVGYLEAEEVVVEDSATVDSLAYVVKQG